MRWLAIAIALAGCGALKAGVPGDAPPGNDGPSGPDAPAACTTSVDFQPAQPIAGPDAIVVATGHVSNQQTFASYAWIVKFAGQAIATTQVDQFGAVVQFPITQAGPYTVHFAAGDAFDCEATDTTLQVDAPGAATQAWRLRITPPEGAGAPPQERLITIRGGADNAYGPIGLDPGLDVVSTVVDAGGAPVAAYLRFTPAAAPDTFVEAFSTAAGQYVARVQSGPEDVLIVPASSDLAPVRIAAWQPLAPDLIVPAADAIAGTVSGPGGQPLAGARVALTLAGVPTTIATTDASGAWSVLGHVAGAAGAIDVTVVPPAPSGLPELTATATSLDLSHALAIRYAAIATIDLAGTPVRAMGAAAPGATVTLTGAIASAGSITAGATSATASGVIAATATAGATGLLGSAPVPRAPMTAVVAVPPAMLAVVAIDATAGAPASIDAPAPVAIAGTITAPGGAPRANVLVSLTPTGALSVATLVVPAAVTGADGRFSIAAAPGGHYALAATDRAQQYTDVDVVDVVAGDTGALALGPAIGLTGTLEVTGSSQTVDGAALTLLCATCSGVDRSRPVAQAVSSGGGDFRLAVPDPGTSLR